MNVMERHIYRHTDKWLAPKNWHFCDTEKCSILRFIPDPPNEWNDGKPAYSIFMHGKGYVPITHCPWCGELLDTECEVIV